MLAPQRLNPTVSIPSWASSGDQTVYVQSPLMTPLSELDSDLESELDTDLYLSDYFRMYEFKVRKCMRARSHDWTECPFAHPGEKAMRRDPRKYAYSGIACPEFRKGNCVKGDACEYAHGVFECWLHPSRYRTQPCKDGLDCQRRVCFFAHTAEELRVITPKGFIRPASPVNKVVRSMRNLQLGRMNSLPCVSRGVFRGPGFMSLPSTPTQGVGGFGSSTVSLEEPVMKRVESGRDLRIQMMERIKKESCLGLIADEGSSGDKGEDPDLDWVSKLLQ